MTFSGTARPDLLAIAGRYAADPDRWPVRPRFDPVDRWYARIAERPDHEAWLLTWLPGQETELHDHGGSAGAFVVLSGALVEETVAGGESRGAVLVAGAGRRFGTHHIHRIVNRGGDPAISVHVYAPALRSMTRYHLDARGGLRVAEVARAGVAW
ncbi:cysteine dioxygenase family protein [Micromonospora sp. NPDC049679]|uniref:cysteine dioxygenase n=1 Tax=Micromonospora sp. NPDC049679 TaxID=3155920 RepID=UPI0033BFB7E6